MNNEKMEGNVVIPPSILSFITTDKCTAACKNCCFGCNPHNTNRLTVSEMMQYIDQSVDAYPSIKVLALTGGECFTLGKDLGSIVNYGASKGLIVRVVSNGYWAKSFKQAYVRLKVSAPASPS